MPERIAERGENPVSDLPGRRGQAQSIRATLLSAFQVFDHSGMLIFQDGFESGDLSVWGGSAP